MEVNDELVDKIAALAKLEFKGEEKEAIKGDMQRILNFIDKLGEVDTEGVEPLVYMTDETLKLRADEVDQEISQDEALRNAPDKDSDYFKVPKVLKK
ncbi:Asp-tRNA(Asn)/Glu-tRNA(Gln) amidotransferase subunit GatC [Salibacter halophilus]|uniref:Aspartyl/glutamyl-tRNA(Asn/Gln) amidotransferase subunit C n=1 Tax=Salibacter halophilus TaxID=1803916 RepID=A0A6N6M5W5_9FLAO|nr:Asp-tRNA(Asn)/Glu-tRNA(Gln) amidotransferase subunit GatC [Salibacter halophilus]KAB1063753.1 Asp-tRNA(Asn)/Glu-tRNA(Gln) amidotransferase subunit GatC [Salibacter halophilus]